MLRVISHDLLKLGHPELSTEVIWNSLIRNNKDAILWHELAAIQSAMGESPAVCLRTVQQAMTLSPDAVEFRVTAATLMIRLDQVEQAYQLVRQAVSQDGVDLDCACCLWRLICIFDCFEDHDRMAVCYLKLKSISVN